jgi:hypothetical protein
VAAAQVSVQGREPARVPGQVQALVAVPVPERAQAVLLAAAVPDRQPSQNHRPVQVQARVRVLVLEQAWAVRLAEPAVQALLPDAVVRHSN